MNPKFVFLTLDGRPPISVSDDAAEAYGTLSYSDIAQDLRAILLETSNEEPGEARSVVTDYLATLERDMGRSDGSNRR